MEICVHIWTLALMHTYILDTSIIGVADGEVVLGLVAKYYYSIRHHSFLKAKLTVEMIIAVVEIQDYIKFRFRSIYVFI